MELKIKLPENLPQKIYFFRHGQAENNVQGMLNGKPNYDAELTTTGIQQAKELSSFIKKEKILDEIVEAYVSTFRRSQQTLGIAMKNRSLPKVYIDPRVDEWWKGIYHSLSEEERQKYYPVEETVKEKMGFYQYKPLQGESTKDVQIRQLNFLGSLPNKNVLISGHGSAGTILEMLLIGETWATDNYSPDFKNCELRLYQKTREYYTKESLFFPSIKTFHLD